MGKRDCLRKRINEEITLRDIFGIEEGYSVYCDFNPEKHREKYTNYFESVIDTDGKVYYAVPSHQEFLIRKACEKYDITREELYKTAEDTEVSEMLFNCTEWLCRKTGMIAVWTEYFIGDPNCCQINQLRFLKEKGIYKGEVPQKGNTNDRIYGQK